MVLFTQIISMLLLVIGLLVVVLTGVNDKANKDKYWNYAKKQHSVFVASGIALFATPGFVALFLSLTLFFVAPENRDDHSSMILTMIFLNWIGIAVVGYISLDQVKWFRSMQESKPKSE